MPDLWLGMHERTWPILCTLHLWLIFSFLCDLIIALIATDGHKFLCGEFGPMKVVKNILGDSESHFKRRVPLLIQVTFLLLVLIQSWKETGISFRSRLINTHFSFNIKEGLKLIPVYQTCLTSLIKFKLPHPSNRWLCAS